MPGHYRYDSTFPNEAFVQEAIERYFRGAGFEEVRGGDADFACTHPQTGESWIIEAKGQTSAIDLDFRTGLEHLLQRKRAPSGYCGLAIPDDARFVAQCDKVAPWIRQALRLHWLIVLADGSVRVVAPDAEA